MLPTCTSARETGNLQTGTCPHNTPKNTNRPLPGIPKHYSAGHVLCTYDALLNNELLMPKLAQHTCCQAGALIVHDPLRGCCTQPTQVQPSAATVLSCYLLPLWASPPRVESADTVMLLSEAALGASAPEGLATAAAFLCLPAVLAAALLFTSPEPLLNSVASAAEADKRFLAGAATLSRW